MYGASDAKEVLTNTCLILQWENKQGSNSLELRRFPSGRVSITAKAQVQRQVGALLKSTVLQDDTCHEMLTQVFCEGAMKCPVP